MLKGVQTIKQRTQETEDMSSKNRIMVLGLQSGESALLRFFTDTDGIIKDKVHSVQTLRPDGTTSWRKYRCTKEDTGICQYCSSGERPSYVLYLWAYVYYKLHQNQNPKLNTDDNAEKWAPTKVGTSTYYKEEINSPMIFRSTLGGKDKSIEKAFFEYSDEYGTWCDRDYKWSRSGKGLDTTYLLTPKTESKLSKELKELKDSLPELSDYVLGKVKSFDSTEEEVTETEETEEDKPKVKRSIFKKNQEPEEELF